VSSSRRPPCELRAAGADTGVRRSAHTQRKLHMTVYVLLLMVVALVIYLFYAVIHPEHF
jgi:K+-transporting ATPase KdpF subunit